MTAPTLTARTTPVGLKLNDGFSTKIAFAADPDISFWEKTVQPPGWDGGDAIDVTTMHNTTYRTFAARALVTLTESSLTVMYDPACYTQIRAIINVETSISVHFPDGSTLTFYGYLRSFEVGDHVEGEPPEATIVIQPTNVDPVTGGEEAPVVVSVAGT